MDTEAKCVLIPLSQISTPARRSFRRCFFTFRRLVCFIVAILTMASVTQARADFLTFSGTLVSSDWGLLSNTPVTGAPTLISGWVSYQEPINNGRFGTDAPIFSYFFSLQNSNGSLWEASILQPPYGSVSVQDNTPVGSQFPNQHLEDIFSLSSQHNIVDGFSGPTASPVSADMADSAYWMTVVGLSSPPKLVSFGLRFSDPTGSVLDAGEVPGPGFDLNQFASRGASIQMVSNDGRTQRFFYDVTATVNVPEPSTGFLLMFSMFLALLLRRLRFFPCEQ